MANKAKLSDALSLLIKRIECNDLKNVEMFGGKNDVYVVFDWCDTKFQTVVKDDSGANAVFEEKNMKIIPDSVKNFTLKVGVWDKNSLRSDVHIGDAEIEISDILNEDKSYSSDIFDKSKKKSGSIKLDMHLLSMTPLAPAVVAAAAPAVISNDSKNAVPTSAAKVDIIQSSTSSDITDGNSASASTAKSKQPPPTATAAAATAATVGAVAASDVKPADAKSSASSDIKDSAPASASTAKSKQPPPTATAVAATAATVGAVTASDVKPADAKSSASSDIKDSAPASASTAKSKQPLPTATAAAATVATVGAVSVTTAKPADAKTPAALAPAQVIKPNRLIAKRIECNDLKNVEMFGGKNDVYVVLEWCNKKFTTIVQDEIGANAVFEQPNMSITPDNEPNNFNLKVSVWDENTLRSHVLIGDTEISMSEAVNQDKVYTADIFDKNKKKTGSVTLNINLEGVATVIAPAAAIAPTTALDAGAVAAAQTPDAKKSKADPSTASKDSTADSQVAAKTAAAGAGAVIAAGAIAASGDKTNNKKSASVEKPSVVASPPAAPKASKLIAKRIECSGLKNVEIMGKNDVYVILEWCGKKFTTIVQDDIGANAVFEQADMSVFPDSVPNNFNLKVSVWDENKMRSDVLIGETEIVMSEAVNEDKVYTADIFDKNKKKTGSVTLNIMLEGAAVPKPVATTTAASLNKSKGEATDKDSAALNTTAVEGAMTVTDRVSLLINKIECTNLKNVESFGGKNDVYVIMTWNDAKLQTEVKDEAGSSATFTELGMLLEPDKPLKDTILHIQVFDKNTMMSDVMIGEVDLTLGEVILDKPLDFESDISKSKKVTGHIKLNLNMNKVIEFAKPVLNVPPSSGDPKDANKADVVDDLSLLIQRIECSDLKNVEMLGKNDVYVILTWCGAEFKTKVIEESGATAKYEDPDMILEALGTVTSPIVHVAVYDKNNMTSDVLIGEADISLEPMKPSDKPHHYETDIFNSKKKRTGHIDIKLVISKISKELPIIQKSGFLELRSAKVTDLINREIIGKQDAYLVVELPSNEWKRRTNTIDAIKNAVTWDKLNFVIDVAEVLAERARNASTFKLKVKVFDENSLRNDVLCGQVDVNLDKYMAQFNTNGFDVTCDIFDDRDPKKVTGHVTLNFCYNEHNISASSQVAAAHIKLKDIVPTNTETGCIKIISAKVTNLKNTELIGKSDPYLIFKMNDSMDKTKALANAKNVVWDNLNYTYNMSYEELISEANHDISVEAWDENTLRSDVHIGTAKISPTSAWQNLLNETEVTADILDSKNKIVGQLFVKLLCTIIAQPSANVSLLIQRIECQELKNVESMGGKNDVYCILKWNGGSLQTKVREEAGSSATFEEPDMVLDALGTVSSSLLTVSVYDKNNMTKEVLIGEHSLYMSPLTVSDQPRKFELDIRDKNKVKTGHVKIILLVTPPDAKLPEIITGGFLQLRSAKVTDLINREIIGKQDAYLVVQLPSNEWKRRTNTIDAIKNAVTWDKLNFVIDIAEVLAERARNRSTFKLKVQIWDENATRNDVLLGVTDVALDKYLKAFNGEGFDVTCDIFDERSEGKVTGHVTLNFAFNEHDASAVAAIKLKDLIPKDTEKGTIKVVYAKVTNLKNTELIGKSDPYLIFKMNDSIDKTKALPNAGAAVIWDKLDYEYELKYEDLVSEANHDISVEVWDDNTLRSDVQIGTAKISPTSAWQKLMEESEVVTEILDKNSKVVGQLHVRVVCSLVQSVERSFPPGFDFGCLHIYRIRASKLKNTEMLGKQDPFIVINCGTTFEYKTSAQQSGGEDVIFDWLDAKVPMSVDDLKTKTITLTAMDENMLTKAKFIGKGSTGLNAICQLGKEETISVTLKDDKNQNTGKLTLYCRFEEPPQETARDSDDETRVALPATFKDIEMDIYRLCVFDIGNTTLTGAKQDCEVALSFVGDDQTKCVTDRLESNSQDFLWDDLDFNYIADRKFLDQNDGKIIVTVNSFGTLGKTVLGVGVASIRKFFVTPAVAAGVAASAAVPKLPLKDSKKPDKAPPEGKLAPVAGTKPPVSSSASATAVASTSAAAASGKDETYEVSISLYPTAAFNKATNTIDKKKVKGKPKVGRVTMFIKARPVEPTPVLDPSFIKGRFVVNKVKTFNLKNTEMFGGKQDPYFEISFKGQTFKSNVKEGSSVGWENLDFFWEDLVPDDINNQKLKMTLKDSNTSRSDALIGIGEVSLLKCGAKLEKEVDLHVKLLDDKQKPAGRLLITGMLENASSLSRIADEDVEIPITFNTGEVFILNLSVNGLENSVAKHLNQPYLKLEYREWNATTVPSESKDHQDFAFPYLDYKVQVDALSLKTSMLHMMLCSKSMLGGESIVGMADVCLVQSILSVGQPIKVSCPLLDKKKKKIGKIVSEIRLEKSKELPKSIADKLPQHKILPDGITSCVLAINKVQIKNISNREMFGKQDPYIMFNLSGWSESTDTLQNAGNNAEWKDLKIISAELNQDVIKKEKLIVTINDENKNTKDAFIGKGTCILGSKFSDKKFTKEVILTLDVSDETGAITGSMIVYCSLQKVPEKVDLLEDDPKTMKKFNAPQGAMNVKKISCKLTNDALRKSVAGSEVFVGLALTDWNQRTSAVPGAADDLIWDKDMSKLDKTFTKSQLTSSQLNVTLNVMKKKNEVEQIGTGFIMFTKAINHSESFVDESTVLKDSRGRPIGNLIITLAVSPLDKSTDAPPDSATIITAVEKKLLIKQGEVENFSQGSARQVSAMPPPKREFTEPAPAKQSSANVDALYGQVEGIKKNQETITKAVMGLNDTISSKIQQEFDQERNTLMKTIKKSFDKLEKANELNNGTMGLKSMAVDQINEVQLPSDFRKWKVVHVQAWLSFIIELPQYMDPFKDNSIDGPMLMKHIDDGILKNTFGIRNHLHVVKILDAIQGLCDKQEKMEAAARKRMRDMEEARKRRLENKDKTVEPEPEPIRKSKKKYTSNAVIIDGTGERKPDPAHSRARLEYLLKEKNKLRNENDKEMDKSKRIWSFEYTREGAPAADETDILPTVNAFNNSVPASVVDPVTGEVLSNPYAKDIKSVPENCVATEVAAIVKASMLSLSDWLLALDRLEKKRLDQSNSDLLHPLQQQTMGRGASGRSSAAGTGISWNTTQLQDTMSAQNMKAFKSNTDDDNMAYRINLVFNAFIELDNNGASWLGRNRSLTRLKLQGGILALLKLRISWEQYDMLWTALDSKRSGNIDANELINFFTDMETDNRLVSATGGTGGGSKNSTPLQTVLLELCDVCRDSGFTLSEMFASFDRSNDNSISVAEFCSLMNALTGRRLDKRAVYKSLFLIDKDGSKTISKDELFEFVYGMWRQQLDKKNDDLVELHKRKYNMKDNEQFNKSKKSMEKGIKVLQKAIALNFPREVRDEYEVKRSMAGPGETLGPFSALFSSLNIKDNKNKDHELSGTLYASASAGSIMPRTIASSQSDRRNMNYSGEMSSSYGGANTSSKSYDGGNTGYDNNRSSSRGGGGGGGGYGADGSSNNRSGKMNKSQSQPMFLSPSGQYVVMDDFGFDGPQHPQEQQQQQYQPQSQQSQRHPQHQQYQQQQQQQYQTYTHSQRPQEYDFDNFDTNNKSGKTKHKTVTATNKNQVMQERLMFEQKQKQQSRPQYKTSHGTETMLQLPKIRNLDKEEFFVTPETVNQLLNTIS